MWHLQGVQRFFISFFFSPPREDGWMDGLGLIARHGWFISRAILSNFVFLLFINDVVGWNQKKSTRLVLNVGHRIFFSGCFSLESCTVQLFLPRMDENIDTFGSLKDFLKGSL
jgi:hypothetical protein